MTRKTFKLEEIVELLGAEAVLSGKDCLNAEISGLASLQDAKVDQIAFCASPKYLSHVSETNAAAVLVNQEIAEKLSDSGKNLLIVSSPELDFAKLTEVFSNYPQMQPGIHPSAVVHETAVLAEGVSIGPNTVVEKNAEIGEGCVIGAGSIVGEAARLGRNTRLFSNVSVYHQVEIGSDCIIHSGSVLGSDGFGFVPSGNGLQKLYQLGTLIIGDRVEIGSNCTIDRGALSNTVIGNGVKMDNQIHIAHNVIVGENTAFAGCVGVAGSTKIGANCQFGGQVGINGHIEICDGVVVTGKGLVAQSINKPGVYSSGIPASPNIEWRRNIARFGQLNEMYKTLKRIEKNFPEENSK